MITRRKLVIALGTVVATSPLKVVAQPTGSIPTVAVLSLENLERVTSLREGLRKLGYVEGRNIRLEERPAGDRYARLADIANEFVRLKVNVIVAIGSTAVLAARNATSTIPIVMVSGVDPIKEKLAISLSHPGGNVTGVATILQELSAKRLQLTKEFIPGLSRVGILLNPDNQISKNSFVEVQKAAKALNLQLQVVEVRSSGDLDKAFETLVKTRINVFLTLPSSMFVANRKQILELTVKHRLAGFFYEVEWLSGGGLFAYGPSDSEAIRYAAVYVDKILKGAKPGDLPMEQPMRFDFVVNLKTAKALGLKVPQSILVQATKVIE